jgi:hypothetical protein
VGPRKKIITTIVEIEGFPYSKGDSRVLGFLKLDADKDFVNAHDEFPKLKKPIQKGIRVGLHYWLQKVDNRPQRHHGWNASQQNGQYTKCHVFKHVEAGMRLYGFKSHPSKDMRVEICCVVHATTKRENETDFTILDELNRLRQNADVVAAVNSFYDEVQKAEEDEQ